MRLDELETEVADVGAMQHQASVLTLLSIRVVPSINTAQHQHCSASTACSASEQYLATKLS